MAFDFTDFTITMYRGDDEVLTGVVYDTDGVTPLDITGWSLWFTAKNAIADLDVAAVFQKETGAGITLTTPADGEYAIAIDAADTDGLTGNASLFCDLQGKDGAGKVRTFLTGMLSVKAEITRTTA